MGDGDHGPGGFQLPEFEDEDYEGDGMDEDDREI
jgi:hypothetical protein